METIGKVLVGLGALGLCAWGASSADKTRQMVGKSMLELSRMTPDDIREEMVEKAVQVAVNKEVAKTADHLRKRADTALTDRVNSLVDTAYDSVSDKVRDRTDEALKRIDLAKVTDDIRSAADRQIRESVRDKVDSLVDEFKDKISKEFRDRVTDTLFYGRRPW